MCFNISFKSLRANCIFSSAFIVIARFYLLLPIHTGVINFFPASLPLSTKGTIVEARRGIRMMKHLSRYVSRDVLIQLYKLNVRPHIDYGDIIYHKYGPSMGLDFTNKLEQTQYAAALAATGFRCRSHSEVQMGNGVHFILKPAFRPKFDAENDGADRFLKNGAQNSIMAT